MNGDGEVALAFKNNLKEQRELYRKAPAPGALLNGLRPPPVPGAADQPEQVQRPVNFVKALTGAPTQQGLNRLEKALNDLRKAPTLVPGKLPQVNLSSAKMLMSKPEAQSHPPGGPRPPNTFPSKNASNNEGGSSMSAGQKSFSQDSQKPWQSNNQQSSGPPPQSKFQGQSNAYGQSQGGGHTYQNSASSGGSMSMGAGAYSSGNTSSGGQSYQNNTNSGTGVNYQSGGNMGASSYSSGTTCSMNNAGSGGGPYNNNSQPQQRAQQHIQTPIQWQQSTQGGGYSGANTISLSSTNRMSTGSSGCNSGGKGAADSFFDDDEEEELLAALDLDELVDTHRRQLQSQQPTPALSQPPYQHHQHQHVPKPGLSPHKNSNIGASGPGGSGTENAALLRFQKAIAGKQAERRKVDDSIDSYVANGDQVPPDLQTQKEVLDRDISVLHKRIAEQKEKCNAGGIIQQRTTQISTSSIITQSQSAGGGNSYSSSSYTRNTDVGFGNANGSGWSSSQSSTVTSGGNWVGQNGNGASAVVSRDNNANSNGESNYVSQNSGNNTMAGWTAGVGEDRNGAPVCEHNIPCRVNTSKQPNSEGRDFYCCSLPMENPEKCNFFKWVNDDGPSNFTMGAGAAGGNAAQQNPREVLRKTFGHLRYRPGQEEIVRAAMQNRDVFVLIPTGGGKSLCYQLPAVCCPGLTVVFSPLLSLVHDQVAALKSDGVRAASIGSDQDYHTVTQPIMDELYHLEPFGGIKLLYLTPEKLDKSAQVLKMLQNLYRRGMLSRFVIDEAHCLSDWGHDFRPDYLKLDILRREFPNVPIMALTATADKKVMDDAVRRLGMRNHLLHKESFNRPNLEYSIRKNTKKGIVNDIVALMLKYKDESGIVYCLSRKDCEVMCEDLRAHELVQDSGIRVDYYHAERPPPDKMRAHTEWSSGRVKVICATVAFGMGINKPDVRFVVHKSMPKSITHLYQESGRAGRDGGTAECIVFFSFNDKKRLKNMIDKEEMQFARRRHHIDNLYKCVSFCMNEVECRRVLLLDYFGEKFDSKMCKETCDNCREMKEQGLSTIEHDCTEQAREVLRLFGQLFDKGRKLTLNQLTAFWRGEKPKKMNASLIAAAEALPEFGAGHGFSKGEAERILQQMVLHGYLEEEYQEPPATKYGNNYNQQYQYGADYLKRGDKVNELLRGTPPFKIKYRTKKAKAKSTSKRKSKAVVPEHEEEEPEHPNPVVVSSTPAARSIPTRVPVQVPVVDNGPDMIVIDNSDEEEFGGGVNVQRKPTTGVKPLKSKKVTEKAAATTERRVPLQQLEMHKVTPGSSSASGTKRKRADSGQSTTRKSLSLKKGRTSGASTDPDKERRLPQTQYKALLGRIKAWLRARADETAVPLFQIMSNHSADDVAMRCPTTLEELAQCEGFGQAKVDNIGSFILEVINKYVTEMKIVLGPFPAPLRAIPVPEGPDEWEKDLSQGISDADLFALGDTIDGPGSSKHFSGACAYTSDPSMNL